MNACSSFFEPQPVVVLAIMAPQDHVATRGSTQKHQVVGRVIVDKPRPPMGITPG